MNMNKNILSNVIMFAAGAAIGSVVTWKLMKNKCEDLREENATIREVYSDYLKGNSSEEKTESDEEDEEDRREYEKIVNKSGYNNEDNEDEDDDDDEDEDEEEDVDVYIVPYVIVPEEFDENGYETATLFYYADGVLAYGDTNERVDDVEELVCADFAEHFGEYEQDSVFVRNDNLKMDFEILKDLRPYSEVN